jgi:hypothetical protein
MFIILKFKIMVHIFIIFNVKILIQNSSYGHNDIDQPIINKKLLNKLFGGSLGGGSSLITLWF